MANPFGSLWKSMGGDHAKFLPLDGSTFAVPSDRLMIYLLSVSLVAVVAIFTTLIFFVVKYRRREGNEKAHRVKDSAALEIAWVVFPFSFIVAAFFWGASLYLNITTPPKDAENVLLVGKQWMWKMEHENGISEINHLHVQAGKDVRITMISQDVIHSFFIPDFRMKYDVLPGRYTHAWFKSDKPGHYDLLCAQYCGTDHSAMIGVIDVLSPEDYAKWMSDQDSHREMKETSIERGEHAFIKNGCVSCHGTSLMPDQTPTIGPKLFGRFTSSDGEFIRDSIITPNAQIAAGYQATMPTFAGRLTEEEILDLISFLTKTRKEASND